MQLTRQQIEDAVYAAELDPEEDIHWAYSGRAMYGRTCVGIVGDLAGLLRFVRALHDVIGDDTDREDVDEVLNSVRSDSMGLSSIYYFTALHVDPATV